jgi:hypothetical protein
MENIDFPLSQTNRFLTDSFRIFTIPQSVFGDKILHHILQIGVAIFLHMGIIEQGFPLLSIYPVMKYIQHVFEF